MEKFKGTPGPWESKKIHGDLKVIRRGSYEKLAPGMVSYRPVTELENKYDANLIAAAPELLEALQNLISGYEDMAEVGMFDMLCHGDEIEAANAAIKKALGE